MFSGRQIGMATPLLESMDKPHVLDMLTNSSPVSSWHTIFKLCWTAYRNGGYYREDSYTRKMLADICDGISKECIRYISGTVAVVTFLEQEYLVALSPEEVPTDCKRNLYIYEMSIRGALVYFSETYNGRTRMTDYDTLKEAIDDSGTLVKCGVYYVNADDSDEAQFLKNSLSKVSSEFTDVWNGKYTDIEAAKLRCKTIVHTFAEDSLRMYGLSKLPGSHFGVCVLNYTDVTYSDDLDSWKNTVRNGLHYMNYDTMLRIRISNEYEKSCIRELVECDPFVLVDVNMYYWNAIALPDVLLLFSKEHGEIFVTAVKCPRWFGAAVEFSYNNSALGTIQPLCDKRSCSDHAYFASVSPEFIEVWKEYCMKYDIRLEAQLDELSRLQTLWETTTEHDITSFIRRGFL